MNPLPRRSFVDCALAKASGRGGKHCYKNWPKMWRTRMSSITRMATRRVKSVLAWLLAAAIILLMGAGLVFVVTEVL
jgi:hypothetical protein